MKTKIFATIVFLGIIIFIVACSKEKSNVEPTPVTLNTESNLSPTANLGRVLFYDNHLSVNGAISCGTCHKQELGFSDNVAFSRGFENRVTARNTIALQDINFSGPTPGPGFGFSSPLFWDGRENNLSTMVFTPMLNHVEMGMSNIDAVVQRVKNQPYYAELFEKAYGSSEISATGIGNAIATFVSKLTSDNSRFDASLNGGSNLTADEILGRDLFFKKYDCSSCHSPDVPYGMLSVTFTDIGLEVEYQDQGLANTTHRDSDVGKFKVPSLHNIALTAPYMHDGRFSSLDQVLDHYSHGIKNHRNLDARLKDSNGQPLQLNITESDKKALIAFMNTLTDYSMITNPNLSNPFKIK